MRLKQFGVLALLLVACGGFFALLNGCSGSTTNVEVVDLNKVLDVFVATMDELDNKKADEGNREIVEVEDDQSSAERKEFLTLFARNLNQKKLVSGTIGVEMRATGDVHGFKDANTNKKQDAGEKELFKIQIDSERSRLIASDGSYRRDHQYRPRGGFFTGMILGSMLGRGNSYYSGSRASMRPNLGQSKMSPKSYHSGAVSKARSAARSSSSRGRSGSRGVGFGK